MLSQISQEYQLRCRNAQTPSVAIENQYEVHSYKIENLEYQLRTRNNSHTLSHKALEAWHRFCVLKPFYSCSESSWSPLHCV